MRNFQDTFEARKPSHISGFSICMTVPLNIECFTSIHLAVLCVEIDISY